MPQHIGGKKCSICGDRVPDLYRQTELERDILLIIQKMHPNRVLRDRLRSSYVSYYRNTLNHSKARAYLNERVTELHHHDIH